MTTFHAPLLRPISLACGTLLLTGFLGCSSTPPAPPEGAPEPLDARPSLASSPDDGQAIPAPAIVQETSAAPQEPGNYALRADTRDLADRLAHDFGLEPAWVFEMLSQARYQESVARFIMPAPRGTAKNWAVYRSRFIDPIRIKAGVTFQRTYGPDLRRAEARWGVPADIVAGVIGVETIYGRNTGGFRLLDSLTTLSLDFPKGRSDRSAFFQKELGHFLKLCNEQKIAPADALGSYAGAMGLPQFMPSSVRNFAVDFDGDGRIDLQRSPVDAIGSVARYLAEHGWQKNTPAYYEVDPPKDADALAKLLGPDIVPSFTVAEMKNLGATLASTIQNENGLLALVKLENGNRAPSYIAGTDNFYAITRYNQSSYYALAVIQLGQAVGKAYGNSP